MFKTTLERIDADNSVILIQVDKISLLDNERMFNVHQVNEIAEIIIDNKYCHCDSIIQC